MPRLSDLPPSCPETPKCVDAREKKEYSIRLITPLFGGGTQAGTSDHEYPIRVTSIRGHLQFWWRATIGANLEKEQLFDRQKLVWGATDRPSPVDIVVKIQSKSALQPFTNNNESNNKTPKKNDWSSLYDNSMMQYVLFPFMQSKADKEANKQPSNFIENIDFILSITCPECLLSEVETAIRAWVNFGGIGARTRRGCGALYCETLAPQNIDDLNRWFLKIPTNTTSSVRTWPTLPSHFFYQNSTNKALAAWKASLVPMIEFRQGLGKGRAMPQNPKNKYTRSCFPEAETIRKITRDRLKKLVREKHIPDNAFPRASFGLPIIFNFIKGRAHFDTDEEGLFDPPQTTLTPFLRTNKSGDRMASPIILKPLALKGCRTFIPIIIQLITDPVHKVELKITEKYYVERNSKKKYNQLHTAKEAVIVDAHLFDYKSSPFKLTPGAPASGSALEAFIKYATSETFHFVRISK